MWRSREQGKGQSMGDFSGCYAILKQRYFEYEFCRGRSENICFLKLEAGFIVGPIC